MYFAVYLLVGIWCLSRSQQEKKNFQIKILEDNITNNLYTNIQINNGDKYKLKLSFLENGITLFNKLNIKNEESNIHFIYANDDIQNYSIKIDTKLQKISENYDGVFGLNYLDNTNEKYSFRNQFSKIKRFSENIKNLNYFYFQKNTEVEIEDNSINYDLIYEENFPSLFKEKFDEFHFCETQNNAFICEVNNIFINEVNYTDLYQLKFSMESNNIIQLPYNLINDKSVSLMNSICEVKNDSIYIIYDCPSRYTLPKIELFFKNFKIILKNNAFKIEDNSKEGGFKTLVKFKIDDNSVILSQNFFNEYLTLFDMENSRIGFYDSDGNNIFKTRQNFLVYSEMKSTLILFLIIVISSISLVAFLYAFCKKKENVIDMFKKPDLLNSAQDEMELDDIDIRDNLKGDN